jgi:hypothetical protein
MQTSSCMQYLSTKEMSGGPAGWWDHRTEPLLEAEKEMEGFCHAALQSA